MKADWRAGSPCHERPALIADTAEGSRHIANQRMWVVFCCVVEYLTEATIARLRSAGFTPYWHQRIPPNDGGVALGQIAAMMYLNNGG